MTYGGLPQVLEYKSEERKAEYLKALFAETYITDIKERYNVKQDKELEILLDVLSSNIGSLTNPSKLANTFQSEKRVSYEIDFVANKGNQRYYIQSAYRLDSDEKVAQEQNSLRNVDDFFKKIVIVGNPILVERNNDGITTMSVYDFLLKENSLEL